MHKERWQAIIDQIKADPTCWKQTSWHCGTKHCFAGWAQINSGKQADERTVQRDARMWLELSRVEADYYFEGSRTLEDFEWPLSEEAINRAGYNRAGYDCDGLDKDFKMKS